MPRPGTLPPSGTAAAQTKEKKDKKEVSPAAAKRAAKRKASPEGAARVKISKIAIAKAAAVHTGNMMQKSYAKRLMKDAMDLVEKSFFVTSDAKNTFVDMVNTVLLNALQKISVVVDDGRTIKVQPAHVERSRKIQLLSPAATYYNGNYVAKVEEKLCKEIYGPTGRPRASVSAAAAAAGSPAL